MEDSAGRAVSPRSTGLLPGHGPGAAVPLRVLGGAGLLAVAVVPLLFALPHDRVAVDATLPMLGWLPVGVAGVVALDRRPGSRVGWAAVAAALVPAPMLLAGADPGPAWTAPALLVPAVGAGETRRHDRSRAARRWTVWTALVALATVLGAALTWWFVTPVAYGVATTTGLLLLACVVACSGSTSPRPVDEPLLDGALVVGVLVTGLAVGWSVRWFAVHEQVFAADAVGAFAGAVSAVLAAPAALWLRREALARRYGPGVLDPDAVGAITAGLGSQEDPRHLLARAAAMVVATTGAADATVTLTDPADPADPAPRADAGEDDPGRAADETDGWATFPLVVGTEVVGSLAVRGRSHEGLEARQRRIVLQLAPTVALVARAVTLAVEARDARSDLAHEREAERRRIMSDLHDDLGPVLAGMSMRVEAARQLAPTPELATLAGDLAAARADLRRIVSGLGPSAVSSAGPDGGGPGRAVHKLVASFQAEPGPAVVLSTTPLLATVAGASALDPLDVVPPEAAVVAYRTIAEGVTNALRHADPSRVEVHVAHPGDRLVVTVSDDGHGGVIVPGVGLTSLEARAQEVGGHLDVRPSTTGTRVVLVIPTTSRSARRVEVP